MDYLLVVIVILAIVLTSLLKHKASIRKIEFEEQIYRMRHNLPPKDEEKRNEYP